MGRQKLIESAERHLKMELAEIEEWRGKFEENAAYALSWGDSMVQSAARVQVLNEMIKLLKNEKFSEEDIVGKFYRSALRKAQYRESSTSTLSNLMEREVLSASVWVLEKVMSISF